MELVALEVPGLPSEALHLAEVLTKLVPGDPEAHGLAALGGARPGAR